MAVDTRVFGLGNRTGIAPGKTVRAVEDALMQRAPREPIRVAHHWPISHERRVCEARRPECRPRAAAPWCRYPDTSCVSATRDPSPAGPAAVRTAPGGASMAEATPVISSRDYPSWSLRGWPLACLSGLPFRERVISPEETSARDESLLRSSSILVPCLIHDGLFIRDTLAIAECLDEVRPRAEMFPADRAARARCRSISGEMRSGFAALRSSPPMNLRARGPGFKPWSNARADIERIGAIWRGCIETWGGPFLFGARPTVADAMYAPVCTRLRTYRVELDEVCAAYSTRILELPEMAEWTRAALAEPVEIPELESEF